MRGQPWVRRSWPWRGTNHRKKMGAEPFTARDAAGQMVAFRDTVQPVGAWKEPYRRGLAAFEKSLGT